MASVTKDSVKTARQLYKYLLRTCEKLPCNIQDHYKHHVRQGFNSHSDETDPERVQEMIARSMEDADWVLKKYEDIS